MKRSRRRQQQHRLHSTRLLARVPVEDTFYRKDDMMATDNEAGDDDVEDVEQIQTAPSKRTRATKSSTAF